MKIQDYNLLGNLKKYKGFAIKTPVYLFEERILIKKAQEYLKAIKTEFPDVVPYYAVKCNNYPGILKTLKKLNFGFDASSGKELKLLKKIGAQKVIFTGPGKSVEEMLLAIKNFPEIIIHVDSFYELEKIKSLKFKKINICVRINTVYQDEWKKFGIPLGDLKEFYKFIKEDKRINFLGLHFHNSWNYDSKSYIKTLKIIITYLKNNFSKDELNDFKVLDIGGGLYNNNLHKYLKYKSKVKNYKNLIGHCDAPAQGINLFFRDIKNVWESDVKAIIPNAKIITEPGRWLVSHCFHNLIKVIDKKDDNLIITNGGTDNFGLLAYDDYYYPIINLSNPADSEKKIIIGGSLCSVSDVWGYYCFAKKIEIGDVLLIPFQGAYTYPSAQNFIRDIPPVIDIK